MSHTSLTSKSRALFFAISALFLCNGLAGATHLAEALYAEGDWAGARAEALRAKLIDPQDEVAHMIHALAALRMNPDDVEAADRAHLLIQTTDRNDVRARTAYEFGRIRWEAGDPKGAFPLLKQAFGYSDDVEQFLMTAYSLDILLFRHSNVTSADDPVRAQVRTTRPLITIATRQAAAPPPWERRALGARIASAPVRFYQSQISPAIGQRCSMHPSCSAYCIEALREYGLVAIPMTADRLIRETDHVNYQKNPVQVNGETKFYDPVSDHTFWFRRYRR